MSKYLFLFIRPSLYTNLSISAKSPIWKVFSCHIPLHYTYYFVNTPRPHRPYDIPRPLPKHLQSWTPNPQDWRSWID